MAAVLIDLLLPESTQPVFDCFQVQLHGLGQLVETSPMTFAPAVQPLKLQPVLPSRCSTGEQGGVV
jgi:hypothetical protein